MGKAGSHCNGYDRRNEALKAVGKHVQGAVQGITVSIKCNMTQRKYENRIGVMTCGD
jgi:hypothetical protein